MKKIFYFAAALAVILPSSCTKEIATLEVAPQAKTVKVTINATANDNPVSKVALDGYQFKWEEGDKLKFRWANNILGAYEDKNGCEIVSAVGNGANVAFEGQVRYAVESVYAYFSNSGSFHSTTSTMYCHDIPSIQTGRKEDLEDNIAYYARIHKNNIAFNKEINPETGVEEVTSIDFDANMSPAFALLKLNVPAELALTKITLEAESKSYISGRTYIQPHRTWGTFGDGSSFFHRPPVSDDCHQGETITIYRDGEVISGDVYITVAINKYDEDKMNYCCTTNSLSFTFTNIAGDLKYTHSLNEPIYLGTIKDLKSLPATVMSAGILGLLSGNKEEITVGIKAPNPGYKFYYEIAASSEDCSTPTSNSAELDAANGFALTVSDTFVRRYIKVLAKSQVEGLDDCFFEGSLRSWRFKEGSTVLEPLSTWTQQSTPFTTTDGLYIANSKSGNINYKYVESIAGIKLTTSYVSINALPENESKFWMNFYVGSDKRGYNLNVGNATGGRNTYNGYATSQAVTGGTNNCFTWYLGDVEKGLNLALRGDGPHNYYRMTVLEVL